MRLIGESKKLDTQLSRCDLLLEHAEALMKYEEKGIPTIEPLPSALLREYRIKQDELILNGLECEVKDTLIKIGVTISPKTKINHLSKALLKIREYKPKANNSELLNDLEMKLVELIHQTQLNSYLEEAKKAEFKGQRKKALENYYEALYFLKHDEIDDALQSENISALEARIAELNKDIKS